MNIVKKCTVLRRGSLLCRPKSHDVIYGRPIKVNIHSFTAIIYLFIYNQPFIERQFQYDQRPFTCK